MIKDVIGKITSGKDLTREQAREIVSEVLAGEIDDAAIAGLLVALKMKGESIEEITGFAEGLREAAVRINPSSEFLVDTCGTGGDGKGTFNISTAAGFIAAGAGASVAKHGNKGVSSRCGSADVLAELGVDIAMEPGMARRCIEEVGIGFLFAPRFHPAMKHVMNARRSLGVPTVFNILGPLANPAGARSQVLGVNRVELVPMIGEVLLRLGSERAYVVHGLDGMDEFTLTSETAVCEVAGGSTREYTLTPEELGLHRCTMEDLSGGDVGQNAEIVRDVLSGKGGPRLDITVANAALALTASGKADSLTEGVELARESVESGEAIGRLEALIEITDDGRAEGVP